MNNGHFHLFVCPWCLSGSSILLGEGSVVLRRNLRGGGQKFGINELRYEFGQLIIRKIFKIILPQDVTSEG